MISKELLSEILELEEVLDEIIKINDSEIIYRKYNTLGFKFNIYELAYKCKEWSYKKGFILMSGKIKNEYYCEYGTVEYYRNNGYLREIKKANTEPNAIFKACEWILNKDEK